MNRALLVLALLILPASAQAAWHEASSEHFVIYANDNESTLRKYAEQLEHYDAALAKVFAIRKPPPSHSNRVTVYVVSNDAQVRKLQGSDNRFIRGFYIPRAGGSIAFVPRNQQSGGQFDMATIVLLHEYAHHFMISNSPLPMPRWYSEGGAEFFASAKFEKDGGLGIGRAANHRGYELFNANDVTVTDLLDHDGYVKRRGNSTGYDAYYGKAWLMFHYLTFSVERKGQLAQYLRSLSEGMKSPEAGKAVFGDFATLETEVDRYLRQRRIRYLPLAGKDLPIGPVSVRRLREGEAAMLPVSIQSRRGVNTEQAAELVIDARAVAARFPDDSAVLAALAEAEHDAGNHDAAIASAEKAIAADPQNRNARVQKGLALFAKAVDSGEPQDFTKARSAFVALNRLENDHPLPLLFFYRTYTQQSLTPPPVAVDGLARAAELAPFDLELRMMLANQYLRDRKPALARFNLAPVAYNPHGGGAAEMARTMLARLDADPKWDGRGMGVHNGTAVTDDTE